MGGGTDRLEESCNVYALGAYSNVDREGGQENSSKNKMVGGRDNSYIKRQISVGEMDNPTNSDIIIG